MQKKRAGASPPERHSLIRLALAWVAFDQVCLHAVEAAHGQEGGLAPALP
jgi:hypothetical protein